MPTTSLAYLAVKLTALTDPALRTPYFSLYDRIARTLAGVDGLSVHAPHRVTDPHAATSDGLTARDVYLLDRLHVTHADVVVACIELPSFGVGAEVVLASDHGVPIVPFYYAQAGREPSRLILGLPMLHSTTADSGPCPIRYEPNAAGEAELLARILHAVRDVLRSRRVPRPPLQLARQLDQQRRQSGLSVADLADRAGVAREQVELLGLSEHLDAWLARPDIGLRLSIDVRRVDEDRLFLPAPHVLFRLLAVLYPSPDALARALGLT
jgi:hypothetical protein